MKLLKIKPKCLFVFAVFLFLQNNFLFSQSEFSVKNIDSTELFHKKTVYYLLQGSWVLNYEPSYLSLLPIVSPVGERRIPLEEGEGKSDMPYLFEANLDLRFPLIFGRSRGGQGAKRNRITFDYNGTFRMTLDESKPLTPGNQKVGFSWYSNLYNNYTGWLGSKNQSSENQMIDSKKDNLNFLNFLTRFHHYSNGQSPGFYYFPDPNNQSNKRNSYLNGDFSTNYFDFQFTGGVYNEMLGSFHQVSLGYRLDFGSEEGVLAYSKEQEESYGKDRLNLKYDYRTRRFGRNVEHHFRVEMTYILGNMRSFDVNLNNDENNYRFGIKGLYELAPKNHRSVGYFTSIYYGRDYMNIRYDDVVFSLQFGITLSLNKFYIPE